MAGRSVLAANFFADIFSPADSTLTVADAASVRNRDARMLAASATCWQHELDLPHFRELVERDRGQFAVVAAEDVSSEISSVDSDSSAASDSTTNTASVLTGVGLAG